MNDRLRRFVDRYLTHGEARRGAIEAGYSEKRAHVTGSQLLRRPDVAAAIRKRQAERSERLGIDADWVVQRFVDVYEKSMRGSPQTYHGNPILVDGELLTEWSPSGAIGALQGIVKVLGFGATAQQVHEHEGQVIYTLRVDPQPHPIDAESFDMSANT